MKKATLDPSVNLDLYFRKGRDGSKEFRFFSGDVAYMLEDSFEFRSSFETTLVKENNILTLSVEGDDLENARRSSFYELVNVTKNKTWLCGTAYFTDDSSAEITDSEDITIVLEGEPVVININESGGSDHYKGGWDASGDTFPGDENTLEGDFWKLTVGGTLDGVFWQVKTLVMALSDNPGQDADNWRMI